MLNFYKKIFIFIPLTYASYINLTCPCDIHLSCHFWEFFIALTIPLISLFYFNY